MPARESLIGRVFGRLKVLGDGVPIVGKHQRRRSSIVQCECGVVKTLPTDCLVSGNTRSCGCLWWDTHSTHLHTQGGKPSPTHRSWEAMLKRCLYPKAKDYARYGGRGITVCERWRVFEHFLADMDVRPEGKTLDRKDTNGHYDKANCRWATKEEQQRNKRNSRVFTIRGVTGCVTALCEHFGVSPSLFKGRIARGWTAEEAMFFAPVPHGFTKGGKWTGNQGT